MAYPTSHALVNLDLRYVVAVDTDYELLAEMAALLRIKHGGTVYAVYPMTERALGPALYEEARTVRHRDMFLQRIRNQRAAAQQAAANHQH